MIVLAGSFRVPLENLAAAQAYIESSVAQTSREPGCIDYNYAYDCLERNRIRCVCVFRDKAALLHHRQTRHVSVEWPQFVREQGVYDFDVRQYEVQSSVKADPGDLS